MPERSCCRFRQPPLILASSSPRRKEILGLLGLPFTVLVAEVDETPLAEEKPEAAARRVATAKAAAVAKLVPEGLVLGADTVVVYRGQILGKPKDAAEAGATLRKLRGRWHRVITGVHLVRAPNGASYTAAVTTKVWMRHYADAEIDAYVASGEPFDKAGAYAIQSREFHPVERIEGCYLNVVGLPLCEVVKGLHRLHYPLPPDAVSHVERECAAQRAAVWSR